MNFLVVVYGISNRTFYGVQHTVLKTGYALDRPMGCGFEWGLRAAGVLGFRVYRGYCFKFWDLGFRVCGVQRL